MTAPPLLPIHHPAMRRAIINAFRPPVGVPGQNTAQIAKRFYLHEAAVADVIARGARGTARNEEVRVSDTLTNYARGEAVYAWVDGIRRNAQFERWLADGRAEVRIGGGYSGRLRPVPSGDIRKLRAPKSVGDER